MRRAPGRRIDRRRRTPPGCRPGAAGDCPPGAGALLHAPAAGVPGARRRREPARADRPASRGASASASACSRRGPTGWSRPGCSIFSGCRARDSSWPGWPERGVPVVLSPICWYQPRAIAGPRGECLPQGGRPVGVVPAIAPARPALLAPRAARPRRRRPAELAPPRPASSPDCSASRGSDPRRAQRGPAGVRHRDARRLPRALGPGPLRALGRPDRAAEEHARTDPRGPRARACRWSSIGEPVPGHEAYARECRRAGDGFVTWLGRLEHDDPLLASAYAAARVFALPSWFETPGLAALEAALAGSAVAITPFGSTREYFGDLVTYCRPASARGDPAGDLGLLGSRTRPPAGAARRHPLPLADTWPS